MRRVPREDWRIWRGLMGMGDSEILRKKWGLMGEEGGEGEWPNREEKDGEEVVRSMGIKDSTGESGELLPFELEGDEGRMWEWDLEREGREVTRERTCAALEEEEGV